MATYKFRVTFEDHDDVWRDIEIRSTQTFDDLHYAIHNSIGFDASKVASFYMSDDNWKKGKEITSRELNEAEAGKVKVMKDSRLCDFIADPHQKIYYLFDPASVWTFRIELIKISREEEAGAAYPRCIKTTGEAPKQYPTNTLTALPVPEDFDLIGEDDDIEDEVETEDAEELGIVEAELPEGVEKEPFTSSDDSVSDDDFETADEDAIDDEGGADKDDF